MAASCFGFGIRLNLRKGWMHGKGNTARSAMPWNSCTIKPRPLEMCFWPLTWKGCSCGYGKGAGSPSHGKSEKQRQIMANEKADRPDSPSEADILNAVRKSGYVLDQEAATVLEDLKFFVRTSWPYQDPDLGESRELDVWAFRKIEAGTLAVCVELFCECKSGEERPFVFLTRRRSEADSLISPEHYVFPCREYGKQEGTGMIVKKPFSHFGLADHHHWFKKETKAVQLAKIVRSKDRKGWEAQHDGIYNSLLLPLAKALTCRAKDLRSYTQPINLCFPVVVLKSPIYEINTSTKPLAARRVPHVSFYRRLDSKTVKGDYIVDFVTLDGLADFVTHTVTPFVEKVVSLAQQTPQSLLPKPPMVSISPQR